MKLTLTIEGDASALSRVLAALDVVGVTPNPVMPEVAAVAPTLPGAPSPLAMPVPNAPTAPAAPPVAPTVAAIPDDEDGPADANAPATDATGLPWDARIHAKSKALNADKSWRSRRNLDEATKAAVEAELRGAGHVVAGAPVPVAAPAPAAPPMPVMAPPPPLPTQAQVEAASAPVPQPDPTDIASFMAQLQQQMVNVGPSGAPLITPDYLNALVARINEAAKTDMAAISDLSKYPHLIAYTVNVMRTMDRTWL